MHIENGKEVKKVSWVHTKDVLKLDSSLGKSLLLQKMI